MPMASELIQKIKKRVGQLKKPSAFFYIKEEGCAALYISRHSGYKRYKDVKAVNRCLERISSGHGSYTTKARSCAGLVSKDENGLVFEIKVKNRVSPTDLEKGLRKLKKTFGCKYSIGSLSKSAIPEKTQAEPEDVKSLEEEIQKSYADILSRGSRITHEELQDLLLQIRRYEHATMAGSLARYKRKVKALLREDQMDTKDLSVQIAELGSTIHNAPDRASDKTLRKLLRWISAFQEQNPGDTSFSALYAKVKAEEDLRIFARTPTDFIETPAGATERPSEPLKRTTQDTVRDEAQDEPPPLRGKVKRPRRNLREQIKRVKHRREKVIPLDSEFSDTESSQSEDDATQDFTEQVEYILEDPSRYELGGLVEVYASGRDASPRDAGRILEIIRIRLQKVVQDAERSSIEELQTIHSQVKDISCEEVTRIHYLIRYHRQVKRFKSAPREIPRKNLLKLLRKSKLLSINSVNPDRYADLIRTIQHELDIRDQMQSFDEEGPSSRDLEDRERRHSLWVIRQFEESRIVTNGVLTQLDTLRSIHVSGLDRGEVLEQLRTLEEIRKQLLEARAALNELYKQKKPRSRRAS